VCRRDVGPAVADEIAGTAAIGETHDFAIQ
jgi:hypothetical protein